MFLLALYVPIIFLLKFAGVLNRPHSQDPVWWTHRVGAITGVVVKHPDARLSGCVYTVEVESGEFFDEPRVDTALQGQLLLHVVRSTSPHASPGDRIRFVGRVQKPASSKIPGTFDYESYLENQGVHAMVYTSSSSVQNLGPSGKHSLARFGWAMKKKILEAFAARLPPEDAAVLAGLSIGVRPRFHPEIKRIFTESGTMHVLVASGSNVAFVVLFFFSIFRFLLRIPKNFSLMLTLLPVFAYVLIVGSDAPILRAGLMAAVGIGTYLMMREDKAYHALAISALLILLFSPSSLFDVGFQMSFATVFGLIHFLSFGPEWAEQPVGWKRWIFRLIGSSLTAQLWLIPVTTNVFHQFYPVGLLANIVMLPLAAAGLAAALFVTLIPSLVHHYLAALITVAKFFSDTIGKTIWLPSLTPLTVIGFYVSCVFVRHVRRSWLCRLGTALGLLLIIIGVWTTTPTRSSGLKVTWVDLGRDVGCVIQTEEGQNILINAGRTLPSDSTQRTLMPFLTSQGIRKLDAIVLTRSQFDRVAGFEPLYRALKVGMAMSLIEGRSHSFGDLKITKLRSSKSFENNAALLMEYKNNRMVVAEVLSLASQDDLLERGIKRLGVLQARFSPGVRWREEFLKRVRPEQVVDTGPGSTLRPSAPPWELACVVPQQLGWYELFLPEKPDADEARGETTGVRPPSDPAHITANRLRR